MRFKSAIQAYNSAAGKCLQPKAVLFDMDGILFNSMPNHAHSWSTVCTNKGLKMSPEEVYLHEGRTGASTINILTQREWGRDATEEEIEAIYAEKCHLFNQFPEPPKMHGAESVLTAVKSLGLDIHVVTGSGQVSLLERLETHYPGFFSPKHIVSSKDVSYGKPHPEPYLKGLTNAKVAPWEAIVVENAPLGIRSAVAAGAFTIAVNTGPLENEVLLAEGAHCLFANMEELAEAIEDIWAEAMIIASK